MASLCRSFTLLQLRCPTPTTHPSPLLRTVTPPQLPCRTTRTLTSLTCQLRSRTSATASHSTLLLPQHHNAQSSPVSTRSISGHLGYKNKTHSGTAKRIKVLGNGLLKRYPSGKQHSAQTKNSHRIRRLRTAVVIGNEFHARVAVGLPYARTRVNKLKRYRYMARKVGQHNPPALPPRPTVRDKLLDMQTKRTAV